MTHETLESAPPAHFSAAEDKRIHNRPAIQSSKHKPMQKTNVSPMNTTSSRSTATDPIGKLRMFATGVLLIALAGVAHAQPISINSSTTIVQDTSKTFAANESLVYEIANSATLTFTRAATNVANGLFQLHNSSTLKIGPSAANGSGLLVVENITTTGNAAFASVASSRSNTVFDITNAIFRNNHADGMVGVILLNNETAKLFLKNVLFDSNSADGTGGGGAVRSSGAITITSGTFINNHALTTMGALGFQADGVQANVTDVLFSRNRAGTNGGAVATPGNRIVNATLTDVRFEDNWAGGLGGALFAGHSANCEFVIKMTGSGGISEYSYTGNFAGGTTAVAADLQSGTASFGPSAAAGGFYYANNTGTLNFDIAAGVKLTIGAASGTDHEKYDTIASTNTTANLVKSGSGALVLNSDNSYYLGNFAINQGSVILGNSGARLGGAITVASGATFGGAGNLITTSTFAGLASSLTVKTGAIIQIGTNTAGTPETLALTGDLFAENGAIFRFDLFTGGTSDQFFVNGTVAQLSGSSTIDINEFISGTYNLGNITDLANAKVTINSQNQVAGARQRAWLDAAANPGSLLLITGGDISRALTWNTANGTWDTASDNWAGSNSVTKFASGDRVIFSNAANTAITLAGAGDIKVADMRVDSAANITFNGSAGIVADASSVNLNDGTDPDRITDATGRLVKAGAGTLTFANTATNFFKGGIELDGGVLAFDNAAQIDTTGTNIRATGNATLRAGAAIAALAGNIAIDANRTLTFDTQGNAVTHTGALSSSGTFMKSGAGTLTLTGNSSAFAGATRVGAGTLHLANARLGGALSLAAGARLSGAGTAGSGAFNAAAGSIVDVGLDASASGTLAFGGALTLDTATVKFDLFGLQGGNYVSDQITAAGLTLINTSTIQIGAFQSGTYTLAVITGLNGVSNLPTNLVLAIEGGGRQSGTLSVTDTDKLTLKTMADISRAITWSGSGTTWTGAGEWTNATGVNEYASGDRVIFDASAPAANRTIAVSGAVYASDMFVSADGYTFGGSGGIVTGTRYVSNSGAAEFGATASGKLVKTGTGTLTFANTGGNMFEDGLQIGTSASAGGAIVFSDVNQIRTGSTAAIQFASTGTLRTASAAVTGTLTSNIAIADGKTAVLALNGGTLAYSGALSGGATAVFAQGGATDTLTLTGNSDSYAGVTNVTGVMLLNGGTLGGTVNVAGGALFGGRGAATGANSVHADAGSTIQIGTTAGDGTEIFRVTNLQLASGATVTGHGTWSGSATIAAGGTAAANIAGGKTVVLDATIATPTGAVFEKRGPGTLTIAGGKLSGGTFAIQTGDVRASGNGINVNTLSIATAAMLKGTGTITVGSGGLANAGSILVGRAGGDSVFGRLSVQGNYAGGGSLSLAIGNAAAQADVFNVNGTVTGATDVTITPVATITAPANLPKNLITINGGVSAIQDGMFNVLGTGIVIGSDPYAYSYTPTTGLWAQNDVPVPAVPAVTGLDAASILIGKASLESLSKRLMASRDNTAAHDFQLWFTTLYRHDTLSTDMYKGAVAGTSGVQLGADWSFSINNSDTRMSLGVFYDYAKAGMDLSKNIASTDTESNGFGVYAQVRGEKWYVDALYRGASHDYTISVPGKRDFQTNGDAWAAALEIGYVMTDDRGWKLEPQLQLIYQSNYVDDATDSQGLVYRANGTESLEGRAGMRLWEQFQWKTGRFITPYARVSLAHEFKAKSQVLVSDRVFNNDLGGSAFVADGGVVMQLSHVLFVNAGAAWYYSSKIESYSFNVGASLAW